MRIKWIRIRKPPQSNDWNRGSTEFIQQSDYRESLHRRKGATSHIIDIVLAISFAHSSGAEGGIFFYLFKFEEGTVVVQKFCLSRPSKTNLKLLSLTLRKAGYKSFWASWIRRLLTFPSSSKNRKKTLDFYRFVTSFWLFICEEWYKCTFKKK